MGGESGPTSIEIVRATERHGTLIAGITNKGSQPSFRLDKGEEIASIKFRVVGRSTTELAFIPGQSGVRDKYFQQVVKAWTGGVLEYK